MTESTSSHGAPDGASRLTAAQACARLGVKPQTLYAYVSRGLIARSKSIDGRTSLFDLADVTRLQRRSRSRRSAPADITVTSELSFIDASSGRVFYRGVDAIDATRRHPFEAIANLLWNGTLEHTGTWRATGDSPGAVMMRVLEGAGKTKANGTFATRLTTKLGGAADLAPITDVALSVACESGLTHQALVSRLATSSGVEIASAVAAARTAADAFVTRIDAIQHAVSIAADESPAAGADALDHEAVALAEASAPFHDGDARAAHLFTLLRDHDADRTEAGENLAHELRARGGGPPSVWLAIATLAHVAGMPTGAAATIATTARSAGWIAHALEEQRRPTPYRLRLAYTGAPPRSGTPRRQLDAVRDYLERA